MKQYLNIAACAILLFSSVGCACGPRCWSCPGRRNRCNSPAPCNDCGSSAPTFQEGYYPPGNPGCESCGNGGGDCESCGNGGCSSCNQGMNAAPQMQMIPQNNFYTPDGGQMVPQGGQMVPHGAQMVPAPQAVPINNPVPVPDPNLQGRRRTPNLVPVSQPVRMQAAPVRQPVAQPARVIYVQPVSNQQALVR